METFVAHTNTIYINNLLIYNLQIFKLFIIIKTFTYSNCYRYNLYSYIYMFILHDSIIYSLKQHNYKSTYAIQIYNAIKTKHYQ
jgi:hypothetical protein